MYELAGRAMMSMSPSFNLSLRLSLHDDDDDVNGTHHEKSTTAEGMYMHTYILSFLPLSFSLSLSLSLSLPLPPSLSLSIAYGYGSIMIFVISSLSLLGLIFVPCLNQRHRLGWFISRYVLTMLTAMGVSALLCDVMFELIPIVRLTFPPLNITSIPTFPFL